MGFASIALVALAGLCVVGSARNWWVAHDHPSGDQEGYMDNAVACALIACALLAAGWLAAALQ